MAKSASRWYCAFELLTWLNCENMFMALLVVWCTLLVNLSCDSTTCEALINSVSDMSSRSSSAVAAETVAAALDDLPWFSWFWYAVCPLKHEIIYYLLVSLLTCSIKTHALFWLNPAWWWFEPDVVAARYWLLYAEVDGIADVGLGALNVCLLPYDWAFGWGGGGINCCWWWFLL